MIGLALASLLSACRTVSTPVPPVTAFVSATTAAFTATPVPPTATPVVPTASATLLAPSVTPTTDIHSLSGPYLGQVPPGLTPQVFAPGFISLSNASDYAATFSPDGTELYFTRRLASGQNIYETHLVDGIWSTPAQVAFSAGSNAHEPHLTLDNSTLYFGWFHSLPPGETSVIEMEYGIWATDRTATGWSEPRYVGQGMNVSSDLNGQLYVTDLSVDPDSISLVTLTGGRFTAWETINAGAHPGIAPDGSYLVYDRDGGEHLFVRFRLSDGTWGQSIDLTRHGVPVNAGIASISPDGLYLFYAFDGDLYWVSTEIIAASRYLQD